jgi:hypothetical protein
MVISDMTDNAPIFFWQETHLHWGWLSQWYAIEFEHDGITYVTTEMWMMVQKAKLFKDEVGILFLLTSLLLYDGELIDLGNQGISQEDVNDEEPSGTSGSRSEGCDL